MGDNIHPSQTSRSVHPQHLQQPAQSPNGKSEAGPEAETDRDSGVMKAPDF
jgi:hypothetical protein